MKTKIMLAILAIAVVFTNCKKQYACECKSTFTIGGKSSTDTQINTYSEKMNEKQAQSACDETKSKLTKTNNDYASDVSYFSGENATVSTSCSVK